MGNSDEYQTSGSLGNGEEREWVMIIRREQKKEQILMGFLDCNAIIRNTVLCFSGFVCSPPAMVLSREKSGFLLVIREIHSGKRAKIRT